MSQHSPRRAPPPTAQAFGAVSDARILSDADAVYMAHTASIVSAYAAANRLPEDRLLELIRGVFGELRRLTQHPAPQAEGPQQPSPQLAALEETRPPAVPAVPVPRSIQPDYIICLEDGRPVKLLKPYLARRFNLSPDMYRAKWGLPPDYPMVAPTYASQRSEVAIAHGLGRRAAPRPSAKSGKSRAEKT